VTPLRLIPLLFPIALAAQPVVLVVTADASDYTLAAGGTIAAMTAKGAEVHLIRVTNDEKDSYDLPPEETALRNRDESIEAARILAIKEVHSLGYKADELAAVSFTEIRDRLILYIRRYRPSVLFLPNPYTEYDRTLDRYYTGRAAEDAWRAAALENFAPPLSEAGLRPHLIGEVYYYAQPLDPRRGEPESTPTFVPAPKIVDVGGSLDRKILAAQALKTIQTSMAQRLKDRLQATGRRLPLLDAIDDRSIAKLVEENVRGLARVCAKGSQYEFAEEFRYAGIEFRIPRHYRGQ